MAMDPHAFFHLVYRIHVEPPHQNPDQGGQYADLRMRSIVQEETQSMPLVWYYIGDASEPEHTTLYCKISEKCPTNRSIEHVTFLSSVFGKV